MMITLASQSTMFINSAQRILLCVSNMSVEQYIKATTTLVAWKRFGEINDEMGQIIERLKDENLSLIFDTTNFESHIKQIGELHIKVEKVFIDKSPEEIAQQQPGDKDDQSKYQLSPAQLERQKLTQHCFKLDLRNQALKMCVGIIAVQIFLGGVIEGGASVKQTFVKKATLIYGRLLDIVFKLDHIDCEDSGKEYLNMVELVTDKRLMEKYDTIRVIWSEVADPAQIQSKDWSSVLDAVQRDITQLFNDYKFKRLIKSIESSYEEQHKESMLNIEEVYYIDRFKNDNSPWMEISKKIKQDIQNSEQLKESIDLLKNKNKEAIKQNIQQERTMSNMKVTNKSLEQRLTVAQTKIEDLNAVKGENEKLNKNHSVLKKQLESSIKENDGLRKDQAEMGKKFEELEKKAANAPSIEALEG